MGAVDRSRTRTREFIAALDTVYTPPAHWTDQVTDDTVVCRCEEVTGGEIRAAVAELGAGDIRTVKLLTRAGMGWCQGRMCEPAVAGLMRLRTGARAAAVGPPGAARSARTGRGVVPGAFRGARSRLTSVVRP